MSVTIRKLNIGAAMGAFALTPVAIDGAFANDTMSFSVEGGAASSDFTREKLGAPSDIVDDDSGLYGSVEILRNISPVWDWSVSATGLSFDPGSYSDQNNGDAASFDYDFDAAIADLDVGRKWQADRVALRLGVGLTALNTSEDKGLSVQSDSEFDSGSLSFDRSFKGVGVRVGGEVKGQLGENSPFSVYSGASAAVTRGRYSYEKGFNDGEFSDSFSDSGTGNVQHSDFDIGLEYAPNPGTAFRVGVRRDIFSFEDTGILPDEIKTDTAYVGMTINF